MVVIEEVALFTVEEAEAMKEAGSIMEFRTVAVLVQMKSRNQERRDSFDDCSERNSEDGRGYSGFGNSIVSLQILHLRKGRNFRGRSSDSYHG